MSSQHKNDFNTYYSTASRLDCDWDKLKSRLEMLLYQSKQNRDLVMVKQLAKLLVVMYKNNPTKQLLRSTEQRVKKLEDQIHTNAQSHTR